MIPLKDEIIELVDECIKKLENEYRLENHENTSMSDSLIGRILTHFFNLRV